MEAWFGHDSWKAPITEIVPRRPVPVGEVCGLSGRAITAGDRGVFMVFMEEKDYVRPVLFEVLREQLGLLPEAT